MVVKNRPMRSPGIALLGQQMNTLPAAPTSGSLLWARRNARHETPL